MGIILPKKNSLWKPPLGTLLNLGHPLAQGLVGAWPMNEGGGGTVYDVSGNANHATLNSYAGTCWSTGQFGPCFNLLSSSGGFLNLPTNAPALEPTNQVSFGCWFKPNNGVGSGSPMARNQSPSWGNPYVSYYFRLDTLSEFECAIAVNGGYYYSAPSASYFLYEHWSHFMGTYDGSTIRWYLNGAQLASIGGFTGQPIGYSGGSAYFGQDGGNDLFNGLIDFPVVYNRALGAAEVQQLVNEPFCMFQPRKFYLPTEENAGYIQSVQPFSITISSSSTSNTASINTVVYANSVIFWGGYTTASTNTDYNTFSAKAVLTNAGTVTASINTSGAACTVYGTVVEFTSKAVVSIQRGTITIPNGSTSATATINSVTTADSVVFYTGSTASGTNTAGNNSEAALVLTNSTTVTASRGSTGSGVALTVPYTVVQFVSGIINSIQAKATTLTSANTSDTQSITSVVTNNAMIVYNGVNIATALAYDQFYYNLELTASTTVTFKRGSTSTTSRTIYYTVLEFVSGVTTSTNGVQRGLITMTNATSNTASITSVNTSLSVGNFTGFSSSLGSNNPAEAFAGDSLTNATTVTANMNTAASGVTSVAGYEVIQFASSTGTTVIFDGFCPGEFLAFQKIDPRLYLESTSTLQTDRYLSFESLASQANNENVPFESQASQTTIQNMPLETTGGTSVTTDATVLLEFLSSPRIDATPRVEFLASQRTDVNAFNEIIATQQGDATSTLETLAFQSTNPNFPLESNSAQRGDGTLPDEAIASTKQDQTLPVEIVVLSKSDSITYIESLGSQSSNLTTPIDILASQQQNSRLPLDTLTDVQADRISPVESLASQTINPTLPVDTLATQHIDRTLPLETTGGIGVTFDGLLPLESLTDITSDRDFVLETTSATTSDQHSPVEIVAQSKRDALLPGEFTATQKLDTTLQMESIGVVSVKFDGTLPLEFLAGIQADAGHPFELLLIAKSDPRLVSEFLANAVSNQRGGIEVTTTVSSNGTIPLETIQTILSLISDSTLPLEITSTQKRDTRFTHEIIAKGVTDTNMLLEIIGGFIPFNPGAVLKVSRDNRTLTVSSDPRGLKVSIDNRKI